MNRFIIFILVVLFWSCSSTSESEHTANPNVSLIQNPVSASGVIDSSRAPTIDFEEEVYTFGEIKEGEVVQHDFKFTNTGGMPLIIAEARASCGCTVPEWPKEQIMPGASAMLKVKFDSKGKMGSFHKTVSIFANTHPNQNIIKITGNIVK